jgi:LPXTG-motif cell wall-anchored protein
LPSVLSGNQLPVTGHVIDSYLLLLLASMMIAAGFALRRFQFNRAN